MLNNPTSGCLSKGQGNRILMWYLHSHFHCSIIHIAKIHKQPKVLCVDEWIKVI